MWTGSLWLASTRMLCMHQHGSLLPGRPLVSTSPPRAVCTPVKLPIDAPTVPGSSASYPTCSVQCCAAALSVEKLCLQKMPSGQHRSVGMTAAPTSGFFDLPALWTSARTQSRCRPGCQVLLIHAYGRLIHQLQQLSGCGWLCPTRSSLDHSSLCNSRARDMLNLMLPAHSCRCSSPLLGKQEPFITPPWQGS